MKMRRSIWRKLIVLLFAILTAVSVYLAVHIAIPVISTSGIVVEEAPTIETVADPENETSYLTTVKVILKNNSSSNVQVYWASVTVSDGSSSKDLDPIPVVVSKIAPGESYKAEKTYSTNANYDKVSKVSITNETIVETVYGSQSDTKSLPVHVKALIAISIILFGLFIYTCVMLYKSPKKRVHSKHKHHHHHHHSSTDSSHSSHSHHSSHESEEPAESRETTESK